MSPAESNAPGDAEPKIVVDDDWKSRAEREKEELKKKMSEGHDDAQNVPEASFPMLVTTMATQALMNLGQLPDPIEGKAAIRKPLAKHFIDMLSMLEEKTSGNLSEDENAMLGETLHQLRMIYVATPDTLPQAAETSASAPESAPRKPGGAGEGPTIEIPT